MIIVFAKKNAYLKDVLYSINMRNKQKFFFAIKENCIKDKKVYIKNRYVSETIYKGRRSREQTL